MRRASGPIDHVVVDELAAVVEVQPGDLERDRLDGESERGEDVDVGVIARRARERPTRAHIGQVQGPAELPFQRRPAVRDRVALEEPGASSTSSPALRTVIEFRNSGDGFVVEMPRNGSFAFAVAR